MTYNTSANPATWATLMSSCHYSNHPLAALRLASFLSVIFCTVNSYNPRGNSHCLESRGNTYPLLFTITVCPRVAPKLVQIKLLGKNWKFQFEWRQRFTDILMADKILWYVLKIVCAHLPITAIAMQTPQTLRCSFLAWIKIFTIPFAVDNLVYLQVERMV